MSTVGGPPRLSGLSGALIRLGSWIVPRARRQSWLEEWYSEVWHYREERGEGGVVHEGDGLELVWRCLGAPLHALTIWAEEWSVDMIFQDIRLAFRGILRHPGFSLIAILTLSLGIGGNTAIFSVVDSVLLNPLPIPNQDRLVWTWGRMYEGRFIASVSPLDYQDYRDEAGAAFEEFAAYTSYSPQFTYTGGDRPQQITASLVTHNFLSALGYTPALGRGFTAEEVAAESSSAVMISHGFWQLNFGGDPGVLGRTLDLGGDPRTVIGVLPEGLDFPADKDVWLPLTFGNDGYETRAAHFLRPIGLLRSGMALEDAQGILDAVSARLESAYPDTNDEWYAQIQPLRTVTVGSVRPALMILLAAVGFVLLIACANVANLMLSRAAAREGEMAVRASMGASRIRIVRQLLTESLVLAGVAGALGLALAYGAVAAIRSYDPGNLPRIEELGVQGTALGFTLIISVGVGVLFGLAPALSLARTNLTGALGSIGRGRTAMGAKRLRDLLVVGEVGLSMVLLVSAALLVKSLQQVQGVDPGFDPQGTVRVGIQLDDTGGPEGRVVNGNTILAALQTLPGVTAVGGLTALPFSGNGGDTYVFDADNPPDNWQNVGNVAEIRVAAGDYLEAMGIELARGRFFEDSDVIGGPPVTVINESLARRLWPDMNPVGRRMTVAMGELTDLEVIGVASDVRQFGLNEPTFGQFYLSQDQFPRGGFDVVIRTAGDPLGVAGLIREAVWSVDPTQPMPDISTISSMVDRSLAPRRFQTTLLGAFAALAILLAGIGVYGVLAYAVSQQQREIGLRVALGAHRQDVIRMVVRHGLRMVVIGLALGTVGAFFATRVLSSLLFQITPTDPASFVIGGVILGATAMLASYLPARRAASVDPMVALRSE